LMTSVIPANAYGDHYDWDCGNDIMVTAWKDERKIHYVDPEGNFTKKDMGNVTLKIRGNRVWLNGRECKPLLSEEAWYKFWCDRDPKANAEACQALETLKKADEALRGKN